MRKLLWLLLFFPLKHKYLFKNLCIGSCDFESQSFCGWDQVPNKKNVTGFDDFDWILNSGSTPSWSTGPTVDHTKGTALGNILET